MDQNQWNTNNEQTNSFNTQPASFGDGTPPKKAEPNGYAIASLILGVVSIVLCCCTCISIVTAILAIVFAALSRGGQPMDRKALGGMICGIIALVMVVVSVVLFCCFVMETNSEDFMQFYEDFYLEGATGEDPFFDSYYDIPQGIPSEMPGVVQ